MEKISILMVKEHERINDMLDDFQREVDIGLHDAGFLFNKFKWNLEKHFFVEEKAIYTIYESLMGEQISDIFHLMQEHGEVMEMVKAIEEKLRNGLKPEVFKLKEILIKHRKFEDDFFYPKLDEALDDVHRQEVIEKVKEVIRG